MSGENWYTDTELDGKREISENQELTAADQSEERSVGRVLKD